MSYKNVAISEEYHNKLKLHAAKTGKSMGFIVEDLIEEHIKDE